MGDKDDGPVLVIGGKVEFFGPAMRFERVGPQPGDVVVATNPAQWTTMLPTVPGWYWVALATDVTMVHVSRVDDELPNGDYAGYLEVNGISFNDWGDTPSKFVTRYGVLAWQGPLAMPEPPNG